MKKLMLGFLALALAITSCNKYANDFSALKDQINALSLKVDGVVALQTQLATSMTQVSALQTAVAALPNSASIAALSTGLATANTNITAVQTALTALATTGTATKTVVDGLKTDLTALAATVGTNNTALTAKIVAAQASLDALTTFTGTLATQAVVNALTVKVDAAQAGINTLLAAAAVYAGNISITTDNEVDFIAPSFASLGMINGNLTVNTTAISAGKIAKLNGILNNLVGAFGPTTISVTTTALKPLSFNNLAAITGNLTVIGGNLSSVSTVVFPLLTSVTGNMSLALDGPYNYTSTIAVGGNLGLTPFTTTGSTITGTTAVSLPNWTVVGTVNAGTIALPLATSIVMPIGVATSVTAAIATSVTLIGDIPAGLNVDAPLATAININAATAAGNIAIGGVNPSTIVGTVSLPFLTTIGANTLSVASTNKATTFAAPMLVTASAVIANFGTGAGTVDLSKIATSTVTVTGPISLTLPLSVSGQITSTTAKTVTLPLHRGALAPALAAVETLTMGNLDNPINLASYTTLKVASITGKTATASVTTATGAPALTTLTLIGPMVSAIVSNNALLTLLNTSGVINSVTIDMNLILAGVTLAHTHATGGNGSILTVTNNAVLASLTTSTDFMASLTVTGNPLLAVANFASYVTKTFVGNPTITIGTNKFTAAYTNAVAIIPATPTTAIVPYVETTITSPELHSLKAYVALYTAPVLLVNLDIVKIGTGTATTLDVKMSADAARLPVFTAPGLGITTKAEFALVQ
jgi:hypothetical protein